MYCAGGQSAVKGSSWDTVLPLQCVILIYLRQNKFPSHLTETGLNFLVNANTSNGRIIVDVALWEALCKPVFHGAVAFNESGQTEADLFSDFPKNMGLLSTEPHFDLVVCSQLMLVTFFRIFPDMQALL